ncbi:hypothetical protein [Pontibacillus salipaludis]|uniref:Uncharacterized protein n=1 Tax=Pontibacillus salipaludis TaxID=1697394 RepID=A0ABQ1Q1R2_9BACI|nr:hypothetical protein [Pontibacillus salipaludis]GGD10664.1 hypothetical protein GCM10011389_17850 [Pontibacillus salipaludis]
MRPRFGRSLFSLALLLFLAGITINEDFWTSSSTDEDETVAEEEANESQTRSYSHDFPKVSPLDLEDDPGMESDALSVVVIQDINEQKANLALLSYKPNQHTVFVSNVEEVAAQKSTSKMIQSFEDQLGGSVDYYVRVDQESMKDMMDQTMENPAIQEVMAKMADEGVSLENPESVDVAGVMKDMTQMSFLTLLSLKQLATDLSKQMDTNLSLAELLTLRDEIGMDNLLKPLQIKEGPSLESIPTFNQHL